MKKRASFFGYLVVFFGLWIISGKLMAQDSHKALFRVHYDMSHIRDLDKPEEPYKERMLLLAGPSAAVYSSYDRILQGQYMQKRLDEHGTSYPPGHIAPPLMMQGLRNLNPADLYFFAGAQKFYVLENLVINYLYEENYPLVSWAILDENKTIGDFECQKAVGKYKGREWHVWFTEQIPVPFGPWELGGLPGLIIEAEDLWKEVVFSFETLETVDHTTASPDQSLEPGRYGINTLEAQWIALPTQKVQEVSKKEVDRLKQVAAKNPSQFRIIQTRATGGFSHNDSVRPGSIGELIKNPIALKD